MWVLVRACWLDIHVSVIKKLSEGLLRLRGTNGSSDSQMTAAFKHTSLALLCIMLILRSFNSKSSADLGGNGSLQYEFVLLGAILYSSQTLCNIMSTNFRAVMGSLSLLVLSSPNSSSPTYLQSTIKISTIIILSTHSIAWTILVLFFNVIHVYVHSITISFEKYYYVKLLIFKMASAPSVSLRDQISCIMFCSVSLYSCLLVIFSVAAEISRHYKRLKEFSFHQILAVIIFRRLKNELGDSEQNDYNCQLRLN